MSLVPHKAFARCVERYRGNHRLRSFSCWDQFLSMAIAQLIGIRIRVAKSTLADANETRDWRIFADFAQVLIHEARRLYAGDAFDVELEQTVYALDSPIDLCLSLFPWARFRATRGGVKLHTLLDLRGSLPSFLRITEAATHNVQVLDVLLPEAVALYVLDRGYVDFARLHLLTRCAAHFVLRAKRNLKFRRRYSRAVDRATGVFCDQTILLAMPRSAELYPDPLRRVRFHDPEDGKQITLLSNHFDLPALTLAELYRCRWQVELFFKWIKQHLRIKAFYGTSANAVKTQIRIAISVYLLAAILKKRLDVEPSLYTLLQMLSVTLFEKVEISQAFTNMTYTPQRDASSNQLLLFNL